MLQANRMAVKNALGKAYKAIPSKPSYPTLGCFKLVSEDGTLSVWANDLKTAVKAQCAVEGKIPTTIVHAKTFRDLVSKARGQRISMEVEDSELSITSGDVDARLATLDTEDYPNIPEHNDWVLLVEGFQEALRQVGFCTATEKSARTLGGIHLQAGGEQLALSATDRYRVAFKTLDVEGLEIESAIVPYVAAKSVSQIIEGKVSIAYDENTIAFKDDETFLSSQLIDGNFPSIKSFWRDEYETRVVVEVDELAHAVGVARVTGRYFADTIKVAVENGKVSVVGKSGGKGICRTEISGDHDGKDVEFFINAQYVAEALGATSTDLIVLELVSVNAPVLLKPVGDRSHWMGIAPKAVEDF